MRSKAKKYLSSCGCGQVVDKSARFDDYTGCFYPLLILRYSSTIRVGTPRLRSIGLGMVYFWPLPKIFVFPPESKSAGKNPDVTPVNRG